MAAMRKVMLAAGLDPDVVLNQGSKPKPEIEFDLQPKTELFVWYSDSHSSSYSELKHRPRESRHT